MIIIISEAHKNLGLFPVIYECVIIIIIFIIIMFIIMCSDDDNNVSKNNYKNDNNDYNKDNYNNSNLTMTLGMCKFGSNPFAYMTVLPEQP